MLYKGMFSLFVVPQPSPAQAQPQQPPPEVQTLTPFIFIYRIGLLLPMIVIVSHFTNWHLTFGFVSEVSKL